MKIVFNQVSKYFTEGKHDLKVIDGIDWEYVTPDTEGKSLAIIGKSGVGKSTFLHLIAAIEELSAGEILFNEQSYKNLNSNQKASLRLDQIALIFQFNNILPEFTAVENVCLPLFLKGIKKTEAEEKAKNILCEVGLEGRFEHKPGELSGGEQQRVAIARALVTNPKLLLADEPTGSLDPQTSQEIKDLLFNVIAEHNLNLIIATHNHELAHDFDAVYHMHAGGVLEKLK